MPNPNKSNAGACEIDPVKQAAEIAAAIEWCSYSYGHKAARLLVRLRDQLAEAKADAWDEGWADGRLWTQGGPSDASVNPYRDQ